MTQHKDQMADLPKILIVFSNPENTSRLRLDKEHRAIEDLLLKEKYDRSIVRGENRGRFLNYRNTSAEGERHKTLEEKKVRQHHFTKR